MRFFYLAAICLSLLGCSAAKREQLETSTRSFYNAMRRNQTNVVMAFVARDKQENFYQELQKLNRYRITQLEIQSIYPDEEEDAAFVSVLIEFFSPSQAGVHSYNRTYRWSYDEEQKAWLVDEESPLGQTNQF